MLHYLVLNGREPGIYNQWEECVKQIKGYPGGELKTYSRLEDAVSEQNRVAIQKAILQKKKKCHPHHLEAASESEILAMPEQFKIYVDGGWVADLDTNNAISSHISMGMLIYENQNGDPEKLPRQARYGDYQLNGTKHFSEIRALCHALKVAELIIDNNEKIDGIAIITDCFYSVNCVTKWAKKWEKNKWKNSERKTIPNLKEVRYAYNLYKKLKHQGVKIVYTNKEERVQGNETVNYLSLKAIKERLEAIEIVQ